MTLRRCLPPAVALALVAPALSSCQLLGGGSHLDDALEIVPGDATAVGFLDRQAQAERLGIDDLETGADDDELEEYTETLVDERAITTPLGSYVQVMQDSAISEFDVVWWVRVTVEDGVYNAYKLEDVDYDALVDDLEAAGLELEEDDGRYTAEPGDLDDLTGGDPVLDGGYPFDFALGLYLDPDEDLLVTGGAADVAAEVVADDRDSAVDEDSFEDLLESADDPEYAEITTDPSCQSSSRATPELIERLGLGELSAFDAAAYFLGTDDDEPVETGVLRFPDEEAAEADLDAREAYLADGDSLVTQEPVSELGSAELEQDGDLVRMELDLEPGAGLKSYVQFDAFFACGQSSG